MSADGAGAVIDLAEARLRAAYDASTKQPFIVGLCGSQGSGKTMLSEGLEARLTAGGLRVARWSIDDLYLSRAARTALADDIHPLLRTRGVPGTHDVALGHAVIDACARGGAVKLPRYSKERDAPCPVDIWPSVEGPVDCILFEGWCVGAKPQAEPALTEPVNALERDEDGDGRWRRWVNDRLAGEYQQLFAAIDYLLLLKAPDFAVVAAWRKQQEHGLRASLAAQGRGPGATQDDAEIDRFVQHYQRITEHILSEMPGRADLTIALDAERRPLSATGIASLADGQHRL